jgi:hypothetical protein
MRKPLDRSRRGEGAPEDPVQDDAERAPHEADVGPAARHVARRDQDLGVVPVAPERLEERRPMREIGIHGDDVGGDGGVEAGEEGGAVPGLGLGDDVGAPPGGGLRGAVRRAAIGDDELRPQPKVGEDLLERRQEQIQIVALVPGRDDDRDVGEVRGASCHRISRGSPELSCRSQHLPIGAQRHPGSGAQSEDRKFEGRDTHRSYSD